MDNTTKSDFFYRAPVITRCSPPASPRAPRCRSTDDGDGLPGPGAAVAGRRIVGPGLDPNDYLVPDAASPSGFVLRNPIYTEFPGGYNPDFGADLTDMSFVLGLRGDLTDTLTWDLSGRYAENEVEYTLSDTINPSLGRLSPLSFSPGTLTQEESGINLDFVQSFAELSAQRRLRRGVPQRDLQDRGRRRGFDRVRARRRRSSASGPTDSRVSRPSPRVASRATAGPDMSTSRPT